MDERVVHLDQLTSREVGEHMKTNDLIFVPHGPISGHGCYVPLGMHCHGAHAVAVLLARKMGGLVHPPVYQAYAGATHMYPGTVPISYEFQIHALKTVARALHGQGFGRIILVAFTHPEVHGARVAACDLFQFENEMPVAAICATDAMASDKVKALVEGYEGVFSEALMEYAALRILGCPRDVAEPEVARTIQKGHIDVPEGLAPSIRTMRRHKVMCAYRYFEEANHNWHGTIGLEHNGKPDIELGLAVLDAMAEFFVPGIEAMSEFLRYHREHPPKWIRPEDNE